MPDQTREEAAERARLLTVRSYDVELDLTTGDETFRSVSRIRFDAREPGGSTWLDLTAPHVQSVALNGEPVDLGAARGERRIALDRLAAENEVVAVADCAYSRTGEGLHRFVDPADGETYLWSEAFLLNANRMFGCFDQPDLKAPFRVRVRAPEGWTLLSNGAGTEDSPGSWVFAETPPLSTYLVVLVAGRYHSVRSSHDGIELGVHCRQSLAPYFEPEELFSHTRASFDFYHRIFGVPYAFGKYDQAFVPEFNAGAMESPGCVTFTDAFVYRSQVTDAERLTRAEVVAHEMAHMWFGDLVTMRWWDDLWLNESFAQYMGMLTLAEATRFKNAWTSFALGTKTWGYRQDQLPSTHPVSADAPDTDAALLNFDGISYAKGAGVLKQLAAWVGFDAFVAGLRAYISRHAFGNTSLADLLLELEASSGRDLRAWSDAWLRTAGVNRLAAAWTAGAGSDGSFASFAIEQTAPPEHPTLRPHRIAIGLYDIDGSRLVRRERVEADVTGARTDVPALVGVRVPDLVLVNDDDLTWAKIALDERSMATVLDGWLCRIDDSLPRALLWGATWEMTRDAELPAGRYLELVFESIAPERDLPLVEDTLLHAQQAVDAFGRPDARRTRLRFAARRWEELLAEAEPGGDLQLAYARALVAAASAPEYEARIRGWLDGASVPAGLSVDPELRWAIVRRLAALDAIGEAEIAAEHERDATSTGAESAATARAARPDPEAKAAAWQALFGSEELSNHMVRAIARGFWQREAPDASRPWVEAYFAALPEIWRTRTPVMAAALTRLLYPSVLVEDETVRRTDAVLADTSLDAGLRRVLIEQRADMLRAIAARERDAT
jgi:aminopeptidase N